MPKRLFSLDQETIERIEKLAKLPEFDSNNSSVIRAAVADLFQRHFPEPLEAHIIGYQPFVAAADMVCSDLGIDIPKGTTAYREQWSDGRQGDVLSRESLVADGVLE